MRKLPLALFCLTATVAPLGGCSDKGQSTAQAAGTVAAIQVPAVEAPKLRSGRWLMRATAVQGGPADRDLANDETQLVCFQPGATILDAGDTDLSNCKSSITRSASGYVVQAQCSAEGLKSSARGVYSGDLQTTIRADITLSLAPNGQPLETIRVGLDGRYQGPCTGDED